MNECMDDESISVVCSLSEGESFGEFVEFGGLLNGYDHFGVDRFLFFSFNVLRGDFGDGGQTVLAKDLSELAN
jgi:hypothetical protein